MYASRSPQSVTQPGLSDADLTIWYPPGALDPFKLANDRLHHNCDYTPFDGMEFHTWPRFTILRGKVVWDNGQLTGSSKDGQYLKRGLSRLLTAEGRPKDKRRVADWLQTSVSN
jgi:dihydropyrimidinase